MPTRINPELRAGLRSKLSTVFRDFLNALHDFSESDFNRVPFAGSWTPAQVGEHVYKSVAGMPGLINGKVADTSRDPGEKVAGLESMFLDFSTKMKSPDFILPSDKKHDREEMIRSLSAVFDQLIDIPETMDLSLTCLEFEFPGSGHLTRLELLSFAFVHTKRHVHQLEKIKQSI